MTSDLAVVADLLDALSEEVYPSTPADYPGVIPFTGPQTTRDVIAAVLDEALRLTGRSKRELYPAIRRAIAPDATLPVADIVHLCGRTRVLAALRTPQTAAERAAERARRHAALGPL